MKINAFVRIEALAEAVPAEKRAPARPKSAASCEVRLSPTATWVSKMGGRAAAMPEVRSEEVARARQDIQSGAIDQDLDATVDAILMEL